MEEEEAESATTTQSVSVSVSVSVSDLLCLSSPLSSSSSPHSPPQPPLKKPRTLTPNPNLPLLGTIDFTALKTPCNNHCFSFSDSSSSSKVSICCSVLDVKDLTFINTQILVTAFNFLPSPPILEIISWIPKKPSPIPINPSPQSTVLGALRCASPIFTVPNRGSDSFGFLAELVVNCNESKFVYFVNGSCKWRPVVGKLVGKWVEVSGVRKKVVSVGRDARYTMLVTTEGSGVRLCGGVVEGGVEIWKRVCGGDVVYCGVVTGVFMNGMVVELDEKVWVLVTDSRVVPPHSIRVGAIISVRNCHLVRPKFAWIQMSLIGTCVRTSIEVKSFSLPDTRSYVRTESESMLGKFIECLTLSAKFWVLLLVSCFRRKFGKIFSDKELLGSKNKEGLVQAYAARNLESNLFQSQCGIFKDFCKHGQCLSENESNLTSLKLVTPISNLISKCERIWASIISKTQCGAKKVKRNTCSKLLSSRVTSCHCIIRRIISSKDLGFILMGSLKISSSSGWLQMVDATGSIDAVVPDLPSNVNCHIIYEVKDYKLIMEGSAAELDYVEFHSLDAFSCRNIFEQFHLKKKLQKLAFYVLFFLKDSSCLNVPSQIPMCKLGKMKFNHTGEITHLFLISHKFPATKNFQDDSNASSNSTLYAEAIVLPYKLVLQEDSDNNLLADVSFGNKCKESDSVPSQENTEWLKRLNTFGISSTPKVLYLKNDCEEDKRSPRKFPCLVTFSSTDHPHVSFPGYLCDIKIITAETNKHQNQTILLEFKSDSLFIYQSLQLGRYYILKCSNSDQFHTVNNEINSGKILIDPKSIFWKLSFHFGEVIDQLDPLQDCLSGPSSSRISEAYVGDTSHNNIIFQKSNSQMHEKSDVDVRLSPVQIEKDALMRTLPKLGEILSVSSCNQIMRAKVARTLTAGDCQNSDMLIGKLISLSGNIEHIHMYNYKSISYVSFRHFECPEIDQSRAGDIVIHVEDEGHKVQIFGDLTKHAYPVGMGLGANATFHRVLLTCTSGGCPRLMLTSVSYIVINSTKEVGHQHCEKEVKSQLKLNFQNESSENVPLGLISRLSQCVESKLVRVNCRVVTVHTLVFELPKHVSSKSRSRNQLKLPAYNITLAGFMLDDGSCLSCCWATDDRAERLLRLHEITQRPFFNSHRSSKKAKIRGSQDTVGFHLEKMLKKHHRVIIKNNRIVPDISTLGFTFAVDSEEVFSCSEERLIRLIMLNACVGPAFGIIGNMMDSNALLLFGGLEEINVAMPTMPKVWITEVGYLDYLKEARSILQDLSR